MSDIYKHKISLDTRKELKRLTVNPEEGREFIMPKFDFTDDEFEEIKSSMTTFKNNKQAIRENMPAIESLVKDGKERASEMGQNIFQWNRDDVDQELMPELSTNMVKMFNPVRKGREDYSKVVNQLRDLQQIHNELKRFTSPISSKQREEVMLDYNTLPLSDVLEKHGKDTVDEAVVSYAIDEYNRQKNIELSNADRSPGIDSTKFTWSAIERNFERGVPELKHLSHEQATIFMFNLRTNPEFINSKNKDAFIIKALNEWTPFINPVLKMVTPENPRTGTYIKWVPGMEATGKDLQESLTGSDAKEDVQAYTDEARMELMQFALYHYFYEKDDHGVSTYSVPGIIKFAESRETIFKEHRNHLTALKLNAKGIPSSLPEMMLDHSNVTREDIDYMNDIDSQLAFINKALKTLSQIKKVPEVKGEGNFWKALGYTPAVDILSMGLTELDDLYSIYSVAKKANEGEELSFAEEQMLVFSALLGHAESKDVFTRMEKVGRELTPMLPYIATFALTGPAYTATHATVRKALGATTRKLLAKPIYTYTTRAGKKVSMGLYEIAAKNAARVSGSAAQTLASPHYIASNMFRRMQDDMYFYMDPETNDAILYIDENSGEKWGTALWKGGAEHFAEMFTERAGEVIWNTGILRTIKQSTGKGITKRLEKMGFKGLAKRRILNAYMKQRGFKDTAQMLEHIQKSQFGWHGIVEEWSEEFLNSFVGFVTGDMEFRDLFTAEYWDEQLNTFLTVAIFGGVAGNLRVGMEMSIGTDVVIPITKLSSKDGKLVEVEEKVRFPRWIWKEFQGVMTEHGVDQEAFSAFMQRNKDTLSEAQLNQILRIAQGYQAKAMAEEFAGLDSKRGEVKESYEPYKPQSPHITKYDASIHAEQTVRKEELKKLKEEEAKLELKRKRLEEKDEKTAKDKKDLREINRELKVASKNILATEKAYNTTLNKLRVLADKERAEIAEKDAKRKEKVDKANTEHEEKINELEEKRKNVGIALHDSGLSQEERNRLESSKASLKGQVTRANNKHRKSINQAYELPDNATDAQRRDAQIPLTAQEKAEVESYNKQVEEKHPGLVQLGLIEQDPITGQYVEVTPEYIVEQYNRVKQAIDTFKNSPEGFMGYDEFNNEIGSNEYLNHLLTAETALEQKLRSMKMPQNIEWAELWPSEKFLQLSSELQDNPDLSADLRHIDNHTFEMTLPDGRTIRGKYKADAAQNEQVRLADQKVYFEYSQNEKGVSNIDARLNNRKGEEIGRVDKQDAQAKSRYKAQKKKTADSAKLVAGALADALADSFNARISITELPSQQDHVNSLKELVVQLINDMIDTLSIGIEEFMKHLKYQIQQHERIPAEYKDLIIQMAEGNKEMISKELLRRQEQRKKKIKDARTNISAKDLVVPSMDAPHWTEGQKINAHLRVFRVIWNEIAEEYGMTRERAESEFIRIAQENKWQMVKNEADIEHYMFMMQGDNIFRNNILEKLSSLKFDTLVSLFDFYENIRVLKNIAIKLDLNGIDITDLAAGVSYEEFVNTAVATMQSYQYTTPNKKWQKGFESVRARISDHFREATDRQSKMRISLTHGKSVAERSRMRMEQHEADLKLLEEITGIPAAVWNEYFVPQTKETDAHINPEASARDKKHSFKSYLDLLMSDTYTIYNDRQGNKVLFPRLQSSLLWNLQKTKDKENFETAITEFFTSGSEEKNVFSNLYKLSTAVKSPNEYALSGIDVKGDRFSMLSQYNMVLKLADEILDDPRVNRIVDFYKEIGESMSIIEVNGMFIANRKGKGLVPEDMSLKDVMVSTIALFGMEEGSYLGTLGQFGDKGKLYFAKLPKAEMPTEKDIEKLQKTFSDFNEAVDWLYRDVLLENSARFRSIADQYEGTGNEKLRNLAVHYVYNYALNNPAVLEFINGETSQYKNGLVEMVKRGGSANSPGWRLNTNIEGGVGKSYRTVIINDTFILDNDPDYPRLKKLSTGDGQVLMSGEMARKMGVSMGSVYNKLDLFDGVLSSSKILSSFIDKYRNRRGLVKGNWLNVELLAREMPNSIYAKINDLMNKNNIDVVSLTSANKLIEQDDVVIDYFDKDGKTAPKFKLDKNKIFDRSTGDLFVQQDLRHPSDPQLTKQASQFLSNILVLPNASKIVSDIAKARNIQMARFLVKFDTANIKEKAKMLYELYDPAGTEVLQGVEETSRSIKIDWLEQSLNQEADKEILQLIKNGATLNEPGIQQYIRSRIAAAATKQAIDLNVMRAATQEIADMDGQLEGFRISSDGKHYLLPECAVGDPSARIHDYQFQGMPERAISHVNKNKDSYKDLFMPDGTLMEWEIRDNNGVIPGEPQMLTRTPADHPHSHTIARVKFRLNGNLTMLDRQSQLRSGSDFDGDARFNTSFFKDKKGNIIFSDSRNGLTNKVLYNLMLDYIDPANNQYITASIDTKAYDDIAAKYLGNRSTNIMDPRSLFDSRNDNMVGVKMKGILTDINTFFSVLSSIDSGFKRTSSFDIGGRQFNLNKFIKDEYGAMKIHIVNLQNMAFDNAADPKLEAIGINEQTAIMFLSLLMNNQALSSTHFDSYQDHYNAIYEAIEDLAEYFNRPEWRMYTELRRDAASQSSGTSYIEVMAKLKQEIESMSNRVIETDIDIEREIAELEFQIEELERSQELDMDDPNLMIPRSMPKITPESAMRETGGRIGMKSDINPGLLSKDGVSVEQAAEMLMESEFGDHIKYPGDIQDIRAAIIEILLTGKKKYIEKITGTANINQLKYELKELKESSKTEIEDKGVTEETDIYNDIRNLFELSKSLKEVVVFLKLTREVPSDIASFLTAQSVFKNIIENKNEGNFDTSSFFDRDGKLIPLFASAEMILRLGEDVIYSDSADLSRGGQTLINRIWNKFKKNNPKLNFFSNDQISQLSKSLNNAIIILSLDPKRSFKEQEKYIVSRLIELRKEFPNNEFLNNLQRIILTKSKKQEVQIQYDLRRAKVSDAKLDQIRNDFDKLPEQDKRDFYIHAVQKFGSSTSTFNGSYFNHIGLKYRAYVSKLISDKIDQLDDLTLMSPLEKAILTNRVIANSPFKDIRSLRPDAKPSREFLDMALLPYTKMEWTMQELDEVIDAKDIKEIEHIINTKLDSWTTEEGELIFANKRTTLEALQESALNNKNRILQQAEKNYPSTDSHSDKEVRSMMSNDIFQEAFAIEDQALQDFIIEKLRQEYPDVIFFKDRDAFFEFVKTNGGRLFDVSTNAIGHAFQNAVFIDPVKAVQSTAIHEFAHIYWDALPGDHPIKERLRSFYRKDGEFATLTEAELDEQIIIDIGRLSTDRASVRFRGTAFQKFLELIRQFWAAIKNVVGLANKQDLLYMISDHVWNNHAMINSTHVRGQVVVRNMIKSNENINFTPGKHGYTINGHLVNNVTGLVNLTKKPFSAENQIKKKTQQDVLFAMSLLHRSEKNAELKKSLEEEYRTEHELAYSAAQQRSIAVRSIMRSAFKKTDVPESANEMFDSYNPGNPLDFMVDALKTQFIELKRKLLIAYPNLQEEDFMIEESISSKEHNIAGTPHLIVDIGNNNLLLFQIKLSTSPYINSEGELQENYTKRSDLRFDIAKGVPLSIQGDHGLQLHLYKGILESQESPDGKKNTVVGMFVIPVSTSIAPNGKINHAIIQPAADRKEATNPLEKRLQEEREKKPGIRDNMGWISFDPADPTYNRATKLILNKSKGMKNLNLDQLREYKDKLERMGFDEYTIEQMTTAYSYLSNYIGDLANVDPSVISNLRDTGLHGIKRSLSALGYKKDQVLSMSFEQIYYAAMHNIAPESIDSYFKEYGLRTKITKFRLTGAQPQHYRIRIDGERLSTDPKKGTEYIVVDAGTENLKIGDKIIRYYAIDNKDTQLFFHYTVKEVFANSLSVVNEQGETLAIPFVASRGGVLKIEEGQLTEDIDVSDVFYPLYTYTELPKLETHFSGTVTDPIFENYEQAFKSKKGMNPQEWAHYKSSLFQLWDFFNKFNDYEALYNLANNRQAIQDIYEKVRHMHDGVALNLKKFLGDILLDHYIAEAISNENKNGMTNMMPTTLQFYYLITLNKDTLFKDFEPGLFGQDFSFFMVPDFMSAKYVPLTFLYSVVAKANREVIKANNDADMLAKLYNDYVEKNIDELTVELNGQLFWINEREIESLNDTGKEFIKELYKLHRIFDKDYNARVQFEKKDNIDPDAGSRTRVKVHRSRMTKHEAVKRGGKLGRELYEIVQEQAWDNVEVNLKERAVGLGWRDVLDENGNPIKVKFRDIRQKYARKILGKENTREFFGNRVQRSIHRGKVLSLLNIIGGSLYNKYKLDARRTYFKGLDKKSDRVPKFRKPQTVSKELGSEFALAGHFKYMENVIFDYFMKDVLSPYDWIKHEYTPRKEGKVSNVQKYIENQLETVVFGNKDMKSTTELTVELSKLLIRWSSMVYMAYQPKTQAFNFAVGHLQNIIFEPNAYFTGLHRIYAGKRNLESRNRVIGVWDNIVKAKNILVRHGLANMVNETQFEEMDKFFKASKLLTTEAFVNNAYFLLEKAEQSIQIPIFVGMMTEAEWNSYNNKGIPIDQANQLSEARASELTRRVGYIHGFYAKTQAAPSMLHPISAPAYQFRKFAVSLWQKMFGTYRYDRNFHIRSGMAQSLITIVRIMAYAGVTTQQRKMEKIAEGLRKHNDPNAMEDLPFQVAGMNDYFEKIIIRLGDDVTMRKALKNLPANEMRNLKSAIIMLAMTLSMRYSYNWLDDDNWVKSKLFDYFINGLLRRLIGDVSYLLTYDNWEALMQSPAAGVNILLRFGYVAGLSVMTAYNGVRGEKTPFTHYSQNSLYYEQGSPKLLYQIGDVMPVGSTYKLLYKNIYEEFLNRIAYEAFSVSESGDVIKVHLMDGDKILTIGDIRREAAEWRRISPVMNKSIEHNHMIELGFDPEIVAMEREINRRWTKNAQDVNDAAHMRHLKNRHAEGDSTAVEVVDMMKKHSRDVKKIFESTKVRRDKELGEGIKIK